MPDRRRKITDELLERARLLLAEGLPMVKVARIVGLSSASLNACGLKVSGPTKAKVAKAGGA